jgi:hypothetical protein
MNQLAKVPKQHPTSSADWDRLAADCQRMADTEWELRSILIHLHPEQRMNVVRPTACRKQLNALPADVVAEAEALLARLEEALAPATKADVAKWVGLLVGAFPTANTPDPKVYVQLMIAEVLSDAPGRAVLEIALRKVWRSKTFLPAIAEVLSQVRQTQKEWVNWHERTAAVPDLYARTSERIRDAEQRVAEYVRKLLLGRKD